MEKIKSTPAAIIERGTTSMQRTVVGTLGTIVDVAKKRTNSKSKHDCNWRSRPF